MEEVILAYAAAILPPAVAHKIAPSEFSPDFINALACRRGIMSAGGDSKRLDNVIVSAGFILAIDDGGLAAGINHYVVRRLVIRVFYVLYILGFILGNDCRSGGCGF